MVFGFGKKNKTFEAFDNSGFLDNSFAFGASTRELIPPQSSGGHNADRPQRSDDTGEKKGLAARVLSRATSPAKSRLRTTTEETTEVCENTQAAIVPEPRPSHVTKEPAPEQTSKSSRRRWRSPLKLRDHKVSTGETGNDGDNGTVASAKTSPVGTFFRKNDANKIRSKTDDDISLNLADLLGAKHDDPKDTQRRGRRSTPSKGRRSPKPQTDTKKEDQAPLPPDEKASSGKQESETMHDEHSVTNTVTGNSVFSRIRNSSPLRSRRARKDPDREEIHICNPYLDSKESPVSQRHAILRAPSSKDCVSPSNKTVESPPQTPTSRSTKKRSESSPRRRWPHSPNKAKVQHHAMDSPPDSPVSVDGASQISEITTQLPPMPTIEDVGIVPNKRESKAKAFIRSQSTKEAPRRSILAAPSMKPNDSNPFNAQSERHITDRSVMQKMSAAKVPIKKTKHKKSEVLDEKATGPVHSKPHKCNEDESELKVKRETKSVHEKVYVLPSTISDAVAQLEMHASGLSLGDLAADLKITLDPEASLVNHVDAFRKSQRNLEPHKSKSERGGTLSSMPLHCNKASDETEKAKTIAIFATPAKKTRRITSSSVKAEQLKVGDASLAAEIGSSVNSARLQEPVANNGRSIGKRSRTPNPSRRDGPLTPTSRTSRTGSSGRSRPKSAGRSQRPTSAGRPERTGVRSKSRPRKPSEESPRRRSKSVQPKRDQEYVLDFAPKSPKNNPDGPVAEEGYCDIPTRAVEKTRRRSMNLARKKSPGPARRDQTPGRMNNDQSVGNGIGHQPGPTLVPASPVARRHGDESHDRANAFPTTPKRHPSKSRGQRASRLERRMSSRRSIAQPLTPKAKRSMIEELKKDVGSSPRERHPTTPKTPKTPSERRHRANSVGRKTPTNSVRRDHSVDVLATPRREGSKRHSTRVAVPSQAEKEAIAQTMSSRSILSNDSARWKVKLRKKQRSREESLDPEIPQLHIPEMTPSSSHDLHVEYVQSPRVTL